MARDERRRAFLEVWWPRVRIPLRLFLGAVTLVAAIEANDVVRRNGLLALAAMQIALVFWELWVRWHFRSR